MQHRSGGGFDTPITYGIAAFMLNGLYRNMTVFLEDNFLILEIQSEFWRRPVSIKRTNLQQERR